MLDFEHLEHHLGQPLGSSSWLTINQERINAFATASLDEQWIHIDETRARRSPFGSTIAHGFLSLSLLSYFLKELELFPGTLTALNYGLNKVRFPQVIKAGQRIRNHAVLLAAESRGKQWLLTVGNTLEIEGETKPAMIAEALILILPTDYNEVGQPARSEHETDTTHPSG